MGELLRVAAMGIGATLAMDVFSMALRRIAGIASLDYRLVGRWIGHFPSCRLVHDPIASSPSVRAEKWLGWGAHYMIGISFAWVFALLVSPAWFERPTAAPSILFGVATVVVPYFIMQPALGFGIAASRTPSPMAARLKSLATHTMFGVGLYLSALLTAALVSERAA